MLFYDHPVNLERESQGQGRPTISGVWTWGGGVLPQVSGGPDLTIADHPLAAGLAQAAGRPWLGFGELARLPPVWLESGPAEVLIFWDALWWPALTGDGETWCAALNGFESIVAGLSAALAAGRVRSLTLDDGYRWSYNLTSWGRRRFWRRGGLRERLA